MPDMKARVGKLLSLGRTVLLASDGRFVKIEEVMSLLVVVVIFKFSVDETTELDGLTSVEKLDQDKSVTKTVVGPTMDDVWESPCVEEEVV